MYTLKHFWLLISTLLFLLETSVLAEKYVVDLQPESANKLIEVNCLYNKDYNDFWVFGYPVTLSGDDDIYPDKGQGFWTPGNAQRCELQYYGGAYMPMAKSVTVSLYLKGKPQILMSSRYSLVDEEFDNVTWTISESDGEGWFETTFDLTTRALVYNFTLISMPDDLLLLDKIVFDLGDDTTTPTEPPPPTTSRPIDDDDTVLLDTDKDFWTVWEDDCNYIEDYADYWVFGCPNEPKEENEGKGYWRPCSTTKTCTLRFKGSNTILPNTPTKINIDSYIDGDAKINITIQSNQEEFCEGGCTVIKVLTKTDKWTQTLVPQGMLADSYTINIQLIPSENGVVLIDKISLGQPIPGEVTTSDPTSDPSTDGTTTPDGSTGETTTTPKAGSGILTPKLGWLIMPILLTKVYML